MLTRHFGDRMRQLLSQQEELILFRQRIEAGRKLNNALMDIVSNDIFQSLLSLELQDTDSA